MKNTEFRIIDSTLREGEQAPGITFTDAHRRTIIKYLDQVGVDEIELGVASPVNMYLARLVADARKIAGTRCRLGIWSRCLEKDIDFAAWCRPDVLSLSVPASDLHIGERLGKSRGWVQEQLAMSIRQALALDIPMVSVGMEDATRAEPEFLLTLAEIAGKNGAQRVRLADTVGVSTPAAIRELVQLVKNTLAIDVGVHCHNDFGMATANSIQALEAGAGWLDATVLGLGERSGNCRLEEVVGFVTLIQGDERYRPEYLPGLCGYLAEITGIPIPGNHPIVGEKIFTCETGLHQHGLAVNPATYEPYEPGLVGAERNVQFGQKSGRRALHLQLGKQGVSLSDDQAGELVDTLRAGEETFSADQLSRLISLTS